MTEYIIQSITDETTVIEIFMENDISVIEPIPDEPTIIELIGTGPQGPPGPEGPAGPPGDGSDVDVSNLVDRSTDQTIDGLKTFLQTPRVQVSEISYPVVTEHTLPDLIGELPAGPQGPQGEPGADGTGGGELGSNIDFPNSAEWPNDSPAAGFVRIFAQSSEGADPPFPPYVYVKNADGEVSQLLSMDDANLNFVKSGYFNTVAGRLIAGDGTNGSYGLVDPGTDGQVLSVESSEALGLKWINPPSGGEGATVYGDLDPPPLPTGLDPLTGVYDPWRYSQETESWHLGVAVSWEAGAMLPYVFDRGEATYVSSVVVRDATLHSEFWGYSNNGENQVDYVNRVSTEVYDSNPSISDSAATFIDAGTGLLLLSQYGEPIAGIDVTLDPLDFLGDDFTALTNPYPWPDEEIVYAPGADGDLWIERTGDTRVKIWGPKDGDWYNPVTLDAIAPFLDQNKGALIAGTDGDPDYVGAGPDGTVLTADSTVPMGLAYKDPGVRLLYGSGSPSDADPETEDPGTGNDGDLYLSFNDGLFGPRDTGVWGDPYMILNDGAAIIAHGAVADEPRTADGAALWIGSVFPGNAVQPDLLFLTDAAINGFTSNLDPAGIYIADSFTGWIPFHPPLPANVDIPSSGHTTADFDNTDVPPAGTFRLRVVGYEDHEYPPRVVLQDSTGEMAILLNNDEADAYYLSKGVLITGGILVADDVGDPVSLPPGDDGQILSADSTNIGRGVRWVDPPADGGGGALVNPAKISGMLSWVCDPITVSNVIAGWSGHTFLVRIPWLETATPSKLWVSTGSQVATPNTAGQCFAGLYDAAGNKLCESADVSAVLTSTYTGYGIDLLSPPEIEGGPDVFLYVALLMSYSGGTFTVTTPNNNTADTWNNIGPEPLASKRALLDPTERAALPASFSLSGFLSFGGFWAGVS